MSITRRSLLGAMSASTFFLTAGSIRSFSAGHPRSAVRFPQGVASADPRADAVILWTRAEPLTREEAVSILLQVSEDQAFSQLLVQNELKTNSDSDYTVRADIKGLQADKTYFYRFLGAGDRSSRTGRTRTAPAPDQSRETKVAFASCQNYEQGYFGAWARMISDDEAAPEAEQIDFVLHLGDFIYERNWNKRPGGEKQPRYLPPFPDGETGEHTRHAISLADYRHLYKVYLSDPHLQAARARWPFVCTWDDHEFSTDAFQSYSTYGDGAKLEPQRKVSANQAWFEFIPARLVQGEFEAPDLTGDDRARNLSAAQSLQIYRHLKWGSLLDIVLTDSRSYRSPACVSDDLAGELGLPMNPVKLVEIADYGVTYDDGHPPETLPYGDGSLPNPGRQREPGTLLGDAQRNWFLSTLQSSTARWKLWGNALPLVPLRLDLSSLPFVDLEDSLLTVDPWAGFPHEQKLLMSKLQENGVSGVVSLSGDHHMHGVGTVSRSASEREAPAVIVDFTVAGISSSPMFEELEMVARRDHADFQPLVYADTDDGVTPLWNMTMLQGALATYTYDKTGMSAIADWLGPNEANPGLGYIDCTANGYGLATFKADELVVDMVTMSNVQLPFETPPAKGHVAHFRLPLWSAGEQPTLQGPEFTGGAPFPFEAPSV
jgi:alkaline phosphatase D